MSDGQHVFGALYWVVHKTMALCHDSRTNVHKLHQISVLLGRLHDALERGTSLLSSVHVLSARRRAMFL